MSSMLALHDPSVKWTWLSMDALTLDGFQIIIVFY